ncbi:MAG TPA: MnmC family methyltransferase [Candidatus Binatia bacterium]|nr:MnmC family methyltransferase [Candidatus Binatia bacterium]
MSYELVRLRNGAFSLRSLEYGETMHPAVGPVAEAEALYVRQQQIPQRAEKHPGQFVVWDVGFGAAANAIAVINAIANRELLLISFDCTTAPLRFALEHAEELEYVAPFRTQLESLLTQGEARFDHVAWKLHLGNFPELLNNALPAPNAILFDPFSPAKNPEMWTAGLFERVFQLLAGPCSLANFSRSTMFRVSLLLAGFYVGRGEPIARKEETTIAANVPGLIEKRLDLRWLERAQRSDSAEPLWTPTYRKAPLAPSTLERLRGHPQFSR